MAFTSKPLHRDRGAPLSPNFLQRKRSWHLLLVCPSSRAVPLRLTTPRRMLSALAQWTISATIHLPAGGRDRCREVDKRGIRFMDSRRLGCAKYRTSGRTTFFSSLAAFGSRRMNRLPESFGLRHSVCRTLPHSSQPVGHPGGNRRVRAWTYPGTRQGRPGSCPSPGQEAGPTTHHTRAGEHYRSGRSGNLERLEDTRRSPTGDGTIPSEHRSGFARCFRVRPSLIAARYKGMIVPRENAMPTTKLLTRRWRFSFEPILSQVK